MLSIGEFASAVELSVSAVRFYADRGLLTPARTDPATGYRQFSEAQVPRGSMIRSLRLIDMPLKEIARVLGMDPAERDAAVKDHVQHLEHRLSEVRLHASNLHEPDSVASIVRSGDLARAIKQVISAAGSDPSKPQHMCVLIEETDSSIRLAATDSYRLAVRDLVPASVGRSFSIVVAAASIRTWPDQLDHQGGDVVFTIENATLTVQGAHVDLRCPTVPIEFPDYETVLHTSTRLSTTIIIDRQQLLTLLESLDHDGAATLTTSDREVTRHQPPIRCRCGPPRCRDGADHRNRRRSEPVDVQICRRRHLHRDADADQRAVTAPFAV